VVAIHQFVPSLVPHDAISSHARRAQNLFRSKGLESEIYTASAHGLPTKLARNYKNFPPRGTSDAVLLYHLSIGSEMGSWIQTRSERKIVNYHNITPASFFATWEPRVTEELRSGRKQLHALANITKLAITPSRFNKNELEGAGYDRVRIAPILFDPVVFDRGPDRSLLNVLFEKKKRGGKDILFVGRISPNKCQHDIIAAFTAYRRLHDPHARLRLVGGSSSPVYEKSLRTLMQRLKIADAAVITGNVSQTALTAYYKAADIFLCLSEHEGFCVPLLEAMSHKIPIIAWNSSAVTETVDNAGLLLPTKQHVIVASALDRVAQDKDLNQKLISAGSARLQDFSPEKNEKAFWQACACILEEKE